MGWLHRLPHHSHQVVASALQPRLREMCSAPDRAGTTTKPAEQHDDLERYKAAHLRSLEKAQETTICKEEQDGHDRDYRHHRPVEDRLAEGNTLATHDDEVAHPTYDEYD